MLLYRIGREEFIKDTSGIGAQMYGGRWNRVGIAALYTSEYRSLAVLEIIVHFNSKAAFAQNYQFALFEIEDDLIIDIPKRDLPKNWQTFSNDQLSKILEKHFFTKKILALRVPSAVIGEERNIILNPKHPDFATKMKVIKFEKVNFDKRLTVVSEENGKQKK